jgi:TetR/AcrR family transcriptional regulator, transcriptional repressor for nem operon
MLSKSDKTKQFIIEKSAPIFNTKGYAATSMNDILKATGLAKGGVYGNFGSKDEIAVAAFEYSFNMLKEALRFKIGQEKTSLGKLTAILKFYRNYTVDPQIKGGCPVLNTAIDSDDNIPELKERAAAALKELLQSLEYIIQKGVDTGEFSNKLNVQREAMLFYGIIEGGIMMSKVSDNPKMLNTLLDHLKEQLQTRYKQ